ncbi:MAG: carbohydrate-binding protein [Chloroflexota bacterium]
MSNAPQKKLSLARLGLVFVLLCLFTLFLSRTVFSLVATLREEVIHTWFAPYVDVTLTPTFHFEDQTGHLLNDVVLGFVVADPQSPCQPSWGTYYSLDAASRALDLDRRIVRLRERGGNVIVSFGGAINDEIATVCEDVTMLTAAYQEVISRYELTIVDFDIEGAAIWDTGANERRVTAVQQLLQTNESLEIWLTLPVAPHGLDAGALAIVDGFLQAGVELAGFNMMTMNYAESRLPEQSMSEASIAALTAVHQQLDTAYRQAGQPKTEAELWRLLSATPMIGQNDVMQDVFTTADAHGLLAFAQSKDLGRLSFWSANRDMACGAGVDGERVSNTCSGVMQAPFEFTGIFADGTQLREAAETVETEPVNSLGATLQSVTTFFQPETESSNQTNQITAGTTLSATASLANEDPQASPYPLWRPTKAYHADDKVVWQGRVYQAKWWTEGAQPDAPVEHVWETPWRYLGPILESDVAAVRETAVVNGNWPRWLAEKVFVAGDEVEHNDQVFRAKWWTQGDEPAKEPEQPFDHPWDYLGDIDCDDDNCLDSELATTLVVDYGGLTAVSLQIHENDDHPNTVGELLQTYRNQSGQKTYDILQGSYDLVFQIANTERIIDDFTCESDTCQVPAIATTLAVDYGGLEEMRLEIRTDDGVVGTVGELIQTHEGQSGQRSYSVLLGSYDLILEMGAKEQIIDGLDCRLDSCSVADISATLTVAYDGLTDIHFEIRDDDKILGNVGALVQQFDSQRGQRSYHVLRGSYDLVFEKGAANLTLDAFDCRESKCQVGDLTADLTLDYGQLEEVILEIRARDGQLNSVGELIETHDAQSGTQLYKVLRGAYDIVLKFEDATNSIASLTPTVPSHGILLDEDGAATIHNSVDCMETVCFFEAPWSNLVN